jgi:gliding motility-associated-like protein
MKKIILLLSVIGLFSLLPSSASATHISGGEITYEHLGNDSFLVTLDLYYDCSSSFTMQNQYTVTVSSSCTGNQSLPVNLVATGAEEVSQICPSQIVLSTCNGGTIPGMEKYSYTGIIQLSTHCSDYNFSFSQCCRNTSVNAVGQQNFLISATLNSAAYPNNSSPEYTAPPIPYVCANQSVNYNYGVVENDGDSVTYAFVAARRNTTQSITYAAGYSATVPIAGITIDPATGELNFTPTLTGNFVIVVQVTEYNGAGLVISTVERDIQFVVLNCVNTIPATPTSVTNLVNTVGTASFTGALEVTANVGDQFCFDAVFTDVNATDVLTVVTNATSALPGATVATAGTNPVTATVCWTVPPGMNTNNTVTFQVSDSACPISGVNSLAVQIIIPPPSNLTVVITTTGISCFGLCDGTATAVPSGGVGPYSYYWDPLGSGCCQGLSAVTGLCSGAGVLILTDMGDPDPSTNTVIMPYSIATAPVFGGFVQTITDDDCSALCVGGVGVLSYGGTTPRSYLWNSGQTSEDLIGVCAGTYTLTVTDANGCTNILSAVVQEPTPPTIVIDSVDSVTCFGGSDGVVYARAYPTCGVSVDPCAAPVSVVLGTGFLTNGMTTFPAPYGNSNLGARHQMIYTAAELTAAGVLPGTIQSLGFDIAAIGTTGNFANFTIKMGCSSVTDLTGGWETGLTEVFTPKTHTLSVGWNTHNFDVKYFWDGLSNIVVEVCFNNPTLTANGNAQTRYTATTNQSVRYYADNTMNVCSSVALTATSTNRPNVRFGNCASSFTYAWSPAPAAGQFTPTVTSLTAQAYTVTVTSVGDGCTSDVTGTVDQPDLIVPTITITNPISCPGVCDAAISIASVGGIAPYTYVWDNGLPTNTTHSNLCAGTYNVTVTDANACTVTGQIIISEPTPITATTTINTIISCNGVCDGNVTVNGAGGTAPLAYAWPGGLTGATQGSLCAGSYDVTITDGGGCSIVHNVILIEPAVLTVSLATVGVVLCNGDNTVDINSTVTGGSVTYSYAWSSGQISANLTNVGAGTYTLTVTDNHNCTATDQVIITEPTPLVGSVVQTAFIQCNGDLTASITASASGGTANYSYLWSNAITTPINANIGSGNYSVTITDANGCTDVQTINVTEPAAVLANLTITNTISCNGVCDGSVTVAPSGGTGPYTVQWQAGMTTVGNTATNLCAGTAYNVTITDANSCEIIEPILLTEPAVLSATISLDQAISCGGVCDGQITAIPAGGTGPYTYLWSNAATSISLINLCVGNYTVTVTDANACTTTATLNVTEPAVLVGSIAQVGTVLCNGDNTVTLTASAVGGTPNYAYLWSNGIGTAINANVGAGTHTVTVTDANNCTDIVSVIITEPTLLVASNTINNQVSCNAVCDGDATITATGGTAGYTYSWPGGLTGANQNALCAGTYVVTVTDANACAQTTTVIITEPAAIVMSSTVASHATCNGICDGDATVSTSGGTNPIVITWPGGLVGGNQTALCGGTYMVTATDANGCSNTISVVINEPATMTVALAQTGTILCNGDETVSINSTVVGGTIPYTYLWSSGQSSANLTNVGAGTYVVTVTDANLCSATASIIVTEPALLDVTIAQTAFISCGGAPTAALLASGTGGTPGYSFVWSTGATTPAISNLAAGLYGVTITDVNGCTDTASINVTQPIVVTPNQTLAGAISCNGVCDGSVTYLPTGGVAPYTIAWPAGVSAANDTATGLCANTQYIVTITDANTCTVNDTIMLTEPTLVSGTITLDQGISCGGVCDAQITAAGAGGTGPYTYAWSNGDVGATINNLCAGVFTVTITDANGCIGTQPITITEPNLIVTTITQTGTIACFGDSTVTLTATSVGGTAPYTYLWNTGATTAVLANTGAGVYSLITTDVNGCNATTPFTVTEPAILDVTITQTAFISCGGAPTAALLASGTGGTPGYSFVWSNGATTPAITNLASGLYAVTITDINGCTDSASITITQPTVVTPNQTLVSAISCNGVCDGSITYLPIGGVAPYTIAWPAGVIAANDTATGLCANTQYIVTITDANTCTINDTIMLTEPTLVSGIITLDQGISCGGVCDAQITATGAGGTGPYTYAWSNGGVGATINNLCAGVFTVTITDANGCTGTQPITITQPNPVVTTITQTGTIACFDDSTVTLTATSVGGTGPYTYLWNTGATTAVLANTGAGVYSLITTDVNGCNATTPFTVTGPAAIVLTANITSAISCGGGCDAAATIIAVGGTGAMTFSWPGGLTGASQTGLCAGDYIVTVTDASACSDTVTVSIADPLGIVIITNVTSHTSCNGVCDGEANITLTGGTLPLTIAWPSGGTAITETGLCAGAHTVTVTDANGCSNTSTIVINDAPVINFNLVQTGSISCNGDCDGVVSSAVTGGTAPYTVIWPGNDTTDIKTGLCAGAYTVTVVDGNGCSTTQSITVTAPSALTVSLSISSAITCNLACDGEITAAVSGGTAPYTAVWSDASTALVNTGLCDGTYSVTITDANGCSTNASLAITEPLPISATLDVRRAVCGICNGRIRALGTSGGDGGPYTYVWSGGIQLPPFPNTVIGLCPGSYSVTITDGSGCSTVLSTNVSNFGGPNNSTIVSVDPTCFGGSDGTATVTAAGGAPPYTYLWSSNGTAALETGLSAGIYTVTVTDVNGCVIIESDTLNDPAKITNVETIVEASCNGVCDGSISLVSSTGLAPYTYAWSNAMTGASVTGLCAGTYTVTTTDANSCSIIDTFIVGDPTIIAATVSITGTISCNGICDGEMTAVATGGTAPYTMTWSNGGIGNIAVGLCAGTHTVTVTDAGGCTTTANMTITEPSAITSTVTAVDANCGACDGTITMSGTAGGDGGPYTYAWSNGESTIGISSLCAGVYDVTITDGNGCNTVISTPISNVGGPTSTTMTKVDASCNGVCDGSISTTPVGGTAPYTYVWSNGGTTGSETNLCAGIYFVTVTDANGCVFIGTDTIVEPTLIINTDVIVDASCNAVCDGTITLTTSGGTGPYTYAWSNGNTGSSLSSLCAGTYTVTTTDANACTATNTYVVREPTPIVLNIATTTPISCNGVCDGVLTAGVTGGSNPYTYLWSNSMTTNSISGLCDGSYSVTVTDANGCTNTATVSLTEPAAITATITPSNATCGIADGQVVLTNVAGGDGGPYTYLWSTGGVTTTIINLLPATYTVTITDGAGCTVVLSASVSNNGGPTGATFVNRNPSCNGICDGMTRVTPIGGAAPYSYLWSSGSVVDSTDQACDGVYSVTITDASGCVLIVSDTLTEPTIIVNTEIITDASCNGVCDGAITVSSTGGNGTYTYVWSNGDAGASITGLCIGTYTVTTTDANGCSVSDIYTVREPNLMVVTTTTVDVSCFNICDATATASVSGGTSPYTYIWSNGDVGITATSLCINTSYDVTVTDGGGCTSTATVNITGPSEIVIDNMIVTNPSCGASDGALEAVVSGGTPGYTYLWNGSIAGNPITNIPSGSYVLEITDNNGCTITSTIPLSDVGSLTVGLTTTDVPCDGSCVGTATATPSGGTGPFTYAWSNGDVVQTATALCAGLVTVTVTDASGGCSAVDTITVNQVPGLVMTMASTDNTNCGGTCDGTADATVTGSTGTVTYVWSNGGATASITGLCAGTYTVTASDASGCNAIDSVIIVDGIPMTLTVDTVINANCINTNDGGVQVTTAGGIAPYSYNWTGPGGFTSINQNIGFLFVGTYYLTVTDQNGCTVMDTAIVDAESNLAVYLGDLFICDGSDSVTLKPVVTGGSANPVYQWYNLGGAVIGNDSTLTVVVPPDTTYYVVGVVSNGCSVTDTGIVAPGQIPDVDAGIGETIVIGESVTLGGNPTTTWGGSSFIWTPDENLSSNTVANPVASPTETTLFTVSVTNIVGCTNTDTILITVIKKLAVISGFTPNGDGSNDFWELDFLDKYPSAQVDIYNRWGELLFHSKAGYPVPWDGTYEGTDIPVGTYYYVIDLKDGSFPDPISGPVTIIR